MVDLLKPAQVLINIRLDDRRGPDKNDLVVVEEGAVLGGGLVKVFGVGLELIARGRAHVWQACFLAEALSFQEPLDKLVFEVCELEEHATPCL